MESVIEKIRQAREDDKRKRDNTFSTEIVVDGCQVKMRFDAVGDNKVMESIRSMLMSARVEATLAAPTGGEAA